MAGTKISAMPAVGSSGATAWAETDVIPVVDTSATTNRKLTRAQLRAQLFDSPTDAAFAQYSSGSTDWLVKTPTQAAASIRPVFISSPADGDMLIYSSTSADFVAHTPASRRYRTIATSRYTGLIGGTPSIITMSDTSDFSVGLPVKYVVSGSTRYGVVTAVSSNVSITVAGPSLAAAATVSALTVGLASMVTPVQFFIANAYGDGVNSLLGPDMKTYFTWPMRAAFLVRMSAVHNTAAGTTQPKINVNIAGSAVSTGDSNNGIQLSTAGTWVDNTLASISTGNYDIAFGEAVEVACTVAGSPTGGALDLTVLCLFVEAA